MAILGSAEIIVKAVTKDFKKQVEQGFRDAAPTAEKQGEQTAQSFNRGFSRASGRGVNQIFTSDFFARAEQARIAFRNFNRAFNLIFPAVVGVGGAIGALGGGLITLVALLGNAARSGIVLVGALGALGQAAITAAIAFQGVGNAISAGLRAQAGGAAAARNEEAALRRLRDARIELRNLIEKEKPEALAEARERAAEAADAAADATLSAERAERTYFQAQKDTLEALEDLNDAREEAKERLQQLRFEVEGAAISEKRARLEFERARESLQRVQDLPPNSRARQEAELAFAEADLNLRRAIDRNSDLKKEENAATRAGVEGSEEVLRAKERLANAQQAEQDAAIDAARAFRDAAKAQQAAAQAAADASAGGRVEQELDARIARAREAVLDAERALKDAAAGGVNQFAEALRKLSPSAQEFVKTIIANREAFLQFRKTVQEPFFQEFNRSLFRLIELLPDLGSLFAGTSRIVGRLSSGFVDLFLGAENFDRTQRIWKTNDQLIDSLGKTFLNLVDGLLLLLDAAEPVILAFGQWAEQTSSGWVARLKGDFDGVRDSLEESANRASRVFGILGKIGDIFGVIGDAVNEAGGASDIFLGWLERITTEGFTKLKEEQKSGRLGDFFADATESAILVLEIIGNIIKGLLVLGAQPGTQQFLTSLRDATGGLDDFAKEFGTEDGPLASIGKFVEQFFITFGNLLQNESFTIFIDTLTDALTTLNDFLEKESVQGFLNAIAPILAFTLALGVIGGVIRGLFNVFVGFFSFVTGGARLMSTRFDEAFKAVAQGGPRAFLPFLGLTLRLLGIFGLIVTAITLMWQNSETFRTAISGVFAAIGEAFTGVFNSLQAVIGEGTEAGNMLQTVFGVIGDVVGLLLGQTAIMIGALIGYIGGFIQLVANVLSGIGFFIEGFVNIFKGLFALLTGDFDGFVSYMQEAGKSFLKFFASIGVGIANFFIMGINGAIDGWNGFVSKLVVPDWVPLIGGKSGAYLRINRIPTLKVIDFAKGGTVPAQPGGMLARIGEAGRPERIEPLDPDGLSKRDKAMIAMLAGNGGGATINVYPSPGMNETELAKKISREMALQMRRGSV